jgi:uncharacterized protein YqgQ
MKKRPMKKRYGKGSGRGYDFIIKKKYARTAPKYDYLKYFRLVRYWVKRNYDITQADLELFMFLYSENLFTKQAYLDYCQTMIWDKNRWQRHIDEGWIIQWRDRTHKSAALYELSVKGRGLIRSVYKKLNGEQPISETAHRNVTFNKHRNFMDKVYNIAFKRMNQDIKEQRQRPSQE